LKRLGFESELREKNLEVATKSFRSYENQLFYSDLALRISGRDKIRYIPRKKNEIIKEIMTEVKKDAAASQGFKQPAEGGADLSMLKGMFSERADKVNKEHREYMQSQLDAFEASKMKDPDGAEEDDPQNEEDEDEFDAEDDY